MLGSVPLKVMVTEPLLLFMVAVTLGVTIVRGAPLGSLFSASIVALVVSRTRKPIATLLIVAVIDMTIPGPVVFELSSRYSPSQYASSPPDCQLHVLAWKEPYPPILITSGGGAGEGEAHAVSVLVQRTSVDIGGRSHPCVWLNGNSPCGAPTTVTAAP